MFILRKRFAHYLLVLAFLPLIYGLRSLPHRCKYVVYGSYGPAIGNDVKTCCPKLPHINIPRERPLGRIYIYIYIYIYIHIL